MALKQSLMNPLKIFFEIKKINFFNFKVKLFIIFYQFYSICIIYVILINFILIYIYIYLYINTFINFLLFY